MAKAIITINDDDAEAPEGFSVEVSFDPPMPKDKEVLKTMKPPKCALVALKIIDLMNQIAEVQGYEEKSHTQH